MISIFEMDTRTPATVFPIDFHPNTFPAYCVYLSLELLITSRILIVCILWALYRGTRSRPLGCGRGGFQPNPYMVPGEAGSTKISVHFCLSWINGIIEYWVQNGSGLWNNLVSLNLVRLCPFAKEYPILRPSLSNTSMSWTANLFLRVTHSSEVSHLPLRVFITSHGPCNAPCFPCSSVPIHVSHHCCSIALN